MIHTPDLCIFARLMVNTTDNKADWGVIFDIDGTMVDNARFHKNAWIEFGKRHGFPITEEFYDTEIHARCNESIVRKLYEKDYTDAEARDIAEEKEVIYRETFRPVFKEVPGLVKLVEQLHAANVRLAAASNSSTGNVDFVLDMLDIRKYFDYVINRDLVEVGKPDPLMFNMAAEGLKLSKDRCIIMEDSMSGFKAAENAEMAYVVISYGSDPNDLQFAKHASAIHEHYEELTVDELRQIVAS